MTGDETNRLVGERWLPAGTSIGDAILLHGGGQTRHAWRDTARVLAERGWTAIAYDARGHGESAWNPDGDYGTDGHVADLFRMIEGCASRPVLIGASMGGMTSITACGEHAGRFRGLVAVDIALAVDTSESRRIQAFMKARPDGFATLDEAADAVQAYNPARSRPASSEGLKRNLIARDDGRWYWRWDPRLLDHTRDLDTFSRQLRDAAAGIAVPALLVRGRRSEMVSDEALAEFKRIVPQLRHVDIAGASHMVAGDDNDSFSAAVIGFLDDLAAAPSSDAT
ncbi:alpha/beta fold hydrolase [Sphingomonas profundi]|uniref:alpha/beta fold hydrolase n=1 Tax=Alterirhizorhabdus profundi TaxID=2681549 RepID=UPI0018D10642|nr:alpha/beta hydrolase [Sphingomonas profundi]